MASVEEAKCRRAYDSATDIHMSIFDRSTSPDEVAMREAHEQAVQKSMAAFNAGAVGVGSARKKYEDLLQKFFKKAFEDYRRNAFMEADLKFSNVIQSMEKRLRAACNASDAKIDNVAKAFAGRSSLTQAIPVQKKREITEEELQLEPLCNEIMIAFTYHRNGALVSCKYRDINMKFWQGLGAIFSIKCLVSAVVEECYWCLQHRPHDAHPLQIAAKKDEH
ncbi:hypothetical protein Fmac_032812 [Flemingia macrophylla]|uniref:Guanylate-binding protein/Atlastin C-terminal domain-containing protein n=1 Tax=Flemingia macrophylla TaxID=520843 RepID=A0ABD1L602_9FABA